MNYYSGNGFYSYSYIPDSSLEEMIIVSDCCGYTFSKDFYYSRDTFHNHLVMHVLSGTLYVKQYGKTYILNTNDSILMSLVDAHTYYSDKENIAKVIWFHFRGSPVKSTIQFLRKAHQLPIVFQSEKICETIYKCMQICSQHPENFEFQISALLYPTILEVAEPYLLQIHNQNLQEHSWLLEVVDSYVNNHIYEKITLDDLCEAAKMKKCYFGRRFKEILSLSPMQYVLVKKIEYSKSMLLETSESVDVIAVSLGFSDQSHFTKTFKKCVGTTPLKYRKNGKMSKLV